VIVTGNQICFYSSQIELFNLYDDHVSEFKMLLEAWSKKNIWRFW